MLQRNDLIIRLHTLLQTHDADIDEVNIFGIRREGTTSLDDVFDDILGLNINGNLFLFRGTTDPGKAFTIDPFTVDGVTGAAHVVPGYYPNLWQIGLHGDKANPFSHEALIQWGNKITVERDTDRSGTIEETEPVQTGYYGIDFHRAHPVSAVDIVGRYSAGCQVMRNPDEFAFFMNLVKNSKKYKRNSSARFSYLLMTQSDMPEAFEEKI